MLAASFFDKSMIYVIRAAENKNDSHVSGLPSMLEILSDVK